MLQKIASTVYFLIGHVLSTVTLTKEYTHIAAMNTPLHIEKIGKAGRPLFLLHGWGQSLEQLRPLGELLAQNRGIYLVDLPGFGKSVAPGHVWSAYDYASRLIAFLDEKNIKKADFFGHSFGGKVAMCAAIQYPERVHQLILAAPSGLRKHRNAAQKCRFQAIKWSGKILKLIDRTCGTDFFSKKFIPKYGSSDYQNAGSMRPILVRSVNEDLSPEIKTIKSPTLILWGEDDCETPLEMGMRLNKLIANSQLLRLPNKGHHPFQDVGAHLCAYYIIPFLNQ